MAERLSGVLDKGRGKPFSQTSMLVFKCLNTFQIQRLLSYLYCFRAAAWRAQTLATLCSDALSSISEVIRSDRQGQRPLGQSWLFRLGEAGIMRTSASGIAVGGGSEVLLSSPSRLRGASVIDAVGNQQPQASASVLDLLASSPSNVSVAGTAGANSPSSVVSH